MGCGSVREDLEDKIMQIRLQRMSLQMEREKNLKILSELEGHPINMENLPDYLASSSQGKLVKLNNPNLEQNNNNDIKDNNENNHVNNNMNNKNHVMNENNNNNINNNNISKIGNNNKANKNNNIYNEDNN